MQLQYMYETWPDCVATGAIILFICVSIKTIIIKRDVYLGINFYDLYMSISGSETEIHEIAYEITRDMLNK